MKAGAARGRRRVGFARLGFSGRRKGSVASHAFLAGLCAGPLGLTTRSPAHV